jgi:hypothetical protein
MWSTMYLLILSTTWQYCNKCHNPSLGLVIKARACKVVGQEEAWESHGMLPRVYKSVREWTLTLQGELAFWELEFRWISESSEDDCKGQNSMAWRVPYIIGKLLERRFSKMGSHDLVKHLKHKLWPKEGSGVNLSIWLLTTKSWESTQSPCVQAVCDILLESSKWGLQLFFRPHLNRRFARKIMGPQSCGSLNFGNFRTPTWEFWDKMPFGCGPRGQPQSIL